MTVVGGPTLEVLGQLPVTSRLRCGLGFTLGVET